MESTLTGSNTTGMDGAWPWTGRARQIKSPETSLEPTYSASMILAYSEVPSQSQREKHPSQPQSADPAAMAKGTETSTAVTPDYRAASHSGSVAP